MKGKSLIFKVLLTFISFDVRRYFVKSPLYFPKAFMDVKSILKVLANSDDMNKPLYYPDIVRCK